jgi:hypothetical protein
VVALSVLSVSFVRTCGGYARATDERKGTDYPLRWISEER